MQVKLNLIIVVALTAVGCSKTSSGGSSSPAPVPACSPSPPGSQQDSSNAAAAETATALAFANTPLSQAVGACGMCTIATVMAGGTPTPLVNAHPVTLAASGTGGAFYSDAACSAAITSLNLAVGVSAGTFYYASTTAGSSTVTATDTFATPLTAATQLETVGGASSTTSTLPTSTTGSTATGVVGSTGTSTTLGAALAFTSTSQSSYTKTCIPVTLTLQNAGATVAATSLIEILLTTSSSTGAYYNSSSCNQAVAIGVIQAGASAVTAYYADSSAGSPVLTATPAGTTGLGSTSLTLTLQANQ